VGPWDAPRPPARIVFPGEEEPELAPWDGLPILDDE
jgi:hypothetical protein